jgi:hypothetical protein
MIRFTWLQFRAQATVALAALFAFAVVLVLTGPHMASLYASAITGCHGGTCANAANTFLSRLTTTSPYPTVYMLSVGLILAAPGRRPTSCSPRGLGGRSNHATSSVPSGASATTTRSG